METPSQALAKKIKDRLVSEGLITALAAEKMESQLANGKLQAEDWRLAIELSGHAEPPVPRKVKK